MIDDLDIQLAALAMDAYNRGCNQGVSGLDDDTGTSVGDATIYATSEVPSASFYAIAYELGGKTVISYRGTDTFLTENFPQDVDAWRVAFGNPNTEQNRLALEFYKAVLQSGVDPDDVVFTGHSLGGSLAGFVAALEATGSKA